MFHSERKQILVAQAPCPQFVEALKTALNETGYWVFQSFNLQSTRAMHEGCTCPHHGTDHCTCEMAVLLVYHASGDPLTLIADGRDNQTFVYLTEEPGKPAPAAAVSAICAVVERTASNLLLSVDTDQEV